MATSQGLGGTFTVYVFLGDFDEDERRWDKELNLVLASGHLTGSSLLRRADASGPANVISGCANCQAQAEAGTKFADFVPLTIMLESFVASGRKEPSVHFTLPDDPPLALLSTEPEHVIPFLKRNLHWRVVKADGSHVARDDVPGFKVWISDM
jgi:tyrosinase